MAQKKAEEVVRQVSGVAEIKNDLRIAQDARE
jgi:osmotically-inducible protein OsmY